MLDAILFPDDWASRYHSYDPKWGADEVFSMRNGSGDYYFLWFPKAGGAALRGFGHESAMSPWASERRTPPGPWPGLYAGLPESLDYVRSEPAFGGDEVTFCAWWSTTEKTWRIGDVSFPESKDPDGSEALLFILDGKPNTYVGWAAEYTEERVPLSAVNAIYELAPLTDELVRALNPRATLNDVRAEASSMGYPVTSKKPVAKNQGSKREH